MHQKHAVSLVRSSHWRRSVLGVWLFNTSVIKRGHCGLSGSFEMLSMLECNIGFAQWINNDMSRMTGNTRSDSQVGWLQKVCSRFSLKKRAVWHPLCQLAQSEYLFLFIPAKACTGTSNICVTCISFGIKTSRTSSPKNESSVINSPHVSVKWNQVS